MGLSLNTKLYIGVISAFTILVLTHMSPQFLPSLQAMDFVQVLVIFSVLAFLAQVYEVELVYGRNTSTGIALCLATILLGGTLLATTVTFLGTLVAEVILRWGRIAKGFMDFLYRVSFNTGQLVLSAFVGSLAFNQLGGQPLLLFNGLIREDFLFHNQIIPAFGAFTAYAFTNTSLVSGVLTLQEETAFMYHLRFNFKYLIAQVLSLGALGILIAGLYTLSPINLLFVLFPIGLVHVSLRNYMKLRCQAQKTFERVAQLLSERDPYTYEHSNEVAELAEKIARKLGLQQDTIEQIRSAAVIHDIGKLGVPDRILQKPGSLTDEEWVIMKRHPVIGADLLKDLEIDSYILDIVRYEHERWDGSGYPSGLKGEAIPIGARIVAVADVYNALTTDRPYRPAFSREEAFRMMREMRGVKLDPHVIDALFSVLQTAPLQPARTLIKAGAH